MESLSIKIQIKYDKSRIILIQINKYENSKNNSTNNCG